MNMRELAEQLNIPYTTYVNYEKGAREPNSETLIMLANFFDVSIDYLLGRIDAKTEMNKRLSDTVSTIDNDIKKHLKVLLDSAKEIRTGEELKAITDAIETTVKLLGYSPADETAL